MKSSIRPGPRKSLEGSQRADWIVVGAGFAGLSAARRLTQLQSWRDDRAHRCAEDRLGRPRSQLRFMIDLPHDLSSEAYGGAREQNLAEIKLNRVAIAFAQRSLGRSASGRTSSMRAASIMARPTATASRRCVPSSTISTSLGEPYTKLDAADMKRITGTDYYAGGSHMPGTTIIQPAAYVRALAASLERQDLRELRRWCASRPDASIRSTRPRAA